MVRDTSITTYHQLLTDGTLGRRQKEVLKGILNLNGQGITPTDRELSLYLGHYDPNYVRPRRKELLDLGVIINAGVRNCKVTKRKVHSWSVKIGTITTQTPKYLDCPWCQGKGKIKGE